MRACAHKLANRVPVAPETTEKWIAFAGTMLLGKEVKVKGPDNLQARCSPRQEGHDAISPPPSDDTSSQFSPHQDLLPRLMGKTEQAALHMVESEA